MWWNMSLSCFRLFFRNERGDVAKWLRRGSAKSLFGGSNPPVASIFYYAGVVELADTRDLKSLGAEAPYRFNSGLRHFANPRK